MSREYTTRTSVRAARMAFAAQVEEHSRKRISDIGRAENQSVSPEVIEVAHEEIAGLQKRINELAEMAESFKARIANQETVIRMQAETIARMENADINRLLSPKEPPLLPGTTNVPDTQKWAGGWKNLHGWKVPDTDGLHIRIHGDVLQWRNSIESGWVPAEKWDDPVGVHTAPNVRRAGGE